MDWERAFSSLCNKDINIKNNNYKEVDSYKNFRLALTNYLDTHRIIPINDCGQFYLPEEL